MKIKMEIIEKNRKIPENDLRMVPYEEDGKTMTLSERDQYVMIIENEIQKRRELLFEKRNYLKKVRNQNEFLEEVISDYGKYYGYIVEQKQEQMRALDMLNKYINDLIEKENMTSENLKDAKKEQKKIIYEMKKIKKGLDSFTEK
jgi:uncharacterized membrane-anchored protein YhcB (DUF1043 family)